MRSFMKAGMVVAAMAAVLTTGVANAQATDVRELKVPFAFDVNGKVMPAGHYRIERSTDPSVILLRNQAGESMFVTTQVPNDNMWAESPSVTFTRNANGYELSAIAGSAIRATK